MFNKISNLASILNESQNLLDDQINSRVSDFYISQNEILDIRKFFSSFNLDLSDKEINENILYLSKIIEQESGCSKLKNKCFNDIPFHLKVSRYNNQLYFYYEKCLKVETYINENKYKDNFLYNHYKNDEISNANFEDMKGQKVSKEKNYIILKFRSLIENHLWNGMYIYGECGVGKTHLCFVFANWYAKKQNKKICVVYLVDFIRLIKESFNNNFKKELVDKIYNDCLNSDVLIIDDIGSELVSDWFYSNYLLNILNTRYSSKLTTFFNSNYSLDELKSSYISKLKSVDKNRICDRIIDRIIGLTKNNVFEFKGKNWRHD